MQSSFARAEDLDAFLDLAERIEGTDPFRVPPLRAQEAAHLGGVDPFARYGELRAILCRDGDELVGRCAAIHNPRLPEVGQIGYFASVDEPAVLESMLALATPWLAARGARRLVGPMNGGAHRPHRLLVRGFEREPFLFEPRNPPYYPRLFESVGFRPVHRWSSYEFAPERIAALRERLGPATSRAARGHSVVPFALEDPDVLRRLHRLLDRVWAGHVGYAPLDLDEFVACYGGVLDLVPPGYLGVIANARGDDVAIGLSYEDRAAEVRALAGDVRGWGSWKGAPRARRLVLHTMAAVPEERGAGTGLLIVDHAARLLLRDGYEEVVVALVTESLPLFARFAAPTREYVLYELPLA